MYEDNRQDGNVGNLGDILKHTALVQLAEVLAANTTGPINYLDTHAYQMTAPLANGTWQADVDGLCQRHGGYQRYVDLERPYVGQGRYLCSAGLIAEYLPNARMFLAERNAQTRQQLLVEFTVRGLQSAWVVSEAGEWAAFPRPLPRAALLALVDPFVLSDRDWSAACAAIQRLHGANAEGLALVFTSARGPGVPAWPAAPGGWCRAPVATIDEGIFHMAAYATPPLASAAGHALRAVGWTVTGVANPS